MKFKNLFHLICIPLLLALFMSALAFTPALADDSTPPSTETQVVTETPTEEEEVIYEETTVEEEVVTDETETSVVEEEETVAELLESLPEGTDVVVLDEEGEVIPLATEEAAEAIEIVDPIWCPTGIAPKALTGGCSNSYGSLLELLEAIQNGTAGVVPNKNGVIWIEKGNLSDNTWIVFDGNDPLLGNMENYSLTFQGGWSGISGSKLLDTVDPYSYFTNLSLSVVNWKGAVTVNNIVINTLPGVGTSNPTLNIQSTKAIILNNVHLNGNEGNGGVGGQGARLDTTNATATAPASITINNSSFTNNYGTGLYIKADGAVTLKSVMAVNNGGDASLNDYGVYIDNHDFTNTDPSNSVNQPVTISGSNQFIGNQGTGLAIHTYGAVTLNNITAYGNDDTTDNGTGDGYGVYIKNNYDTTASTVKFTGTNLFNNNQINGLYVLTNGPIALNSITAENNGNAFNDADGVVLDNCLDGGSGCTTVAKGVTITGSNNFNDNEDSGLVVVTSGPISINQVTANSNGFHGVDLDNCRANGATCKITTPQNVTLTGTNTFIGNDNGGDGLHILTTGSISLNNITSNNNSGDGVDLVNNVNILKPQGIVIKGVNIFNENTDNGLVALSYSTITLYSLTANNNLDNGVYIDNRGYNGSESALNTRANVTIYGTNRFEGNGNNNDSYDPIYSDGGLIVFTAGNVILYNLYANNNGYDSLGIGDGVYVGNSWAWKPASSSVTKPYAASVTLYGLGSFESNADDGLEIDSKGAVSLVNLIAKSNGNHGVDISSAGEQIGTAITPQKVTLSGTNVFFGNGFGTGGVGSGLYIVADVVTANNITANDNRDNGTLIDAYSNVWADKYLGITLTGFNTFQNNGLDGLHVDTEGNITLNRVDAFDNGAVGIYANADRNLTFVCGMAYSNNRGLELSAGGSPDVGTGILTLKYVNSYVNSTTDTMSYTTLARTWGVCP